jgi:hypothetical protein
VSRQSEFRAQYPDVHPQVCEYFPDYDYRTCVGDRNIICRMDSGPNNKVGHQQRAFSIWWALQQGGPLDLGLDLGSSKGMTPYAIHVDLFGDGKSHPFYGGGPYNADVAWDATRIHEIVPPASLPFITANHSLEHMPAADDDGIVELLVRWMGLLRPSGILAMIVPDNDYFDVWGCDKDHKHVGPKAWGHWDFRARVLDKLLTQTRVPVALLDYNTLDNHFSFDVVLERG